MTYQEWLKDKWIETGGPITQAQAAKVLGCSVTYIKTLIKTQKIKAYIFEKEKPLVSLADISKIANEKKSHSTDKKNVRLNKTEKK